MRLLVLLLFLSSNLFAQTITAAIGPWPPYHSIEDSQADFMTQKIKSVFADSGLELDIHYMPWQRARSNVVSKESDISISWIKNHSRQADFLFSKPIGKSETVFYAKSQSDLSIDNIQSLKDLKVGHVRGYSLPPEVKQAIDNNQCTLDLSKDDHQNLLKLIRGRVDVIVTEQRVVKYYIEKYFPLYAGNIERSGTLSWESDLHIIVARAHETADDLIEMIKLLYRKV